jgi:phage terminase Nu1 subunit (DNA packaging protein)
VLNKKQLAAELCRSTRWIELRMREGLPVLPRRTPSEHARFDLDAVRAWMERRANAAPQPLEARVARLERLVATLAAALNREGDRSGDSQAR